MNRFNFSIFWSLLFVHSDVVVKKSKYEKRLSTRRTRRVNWGIFEIHKLRVNEFEGVNSAAMKLSFSIFASDSYPMNFNFFDFIKKTEVCTTWKDGMRQLT